jgi:outer membrane protein TolC
MLRKTILSACAIIPLLAWVSPAAALEPLPKFLEGAKANNWDAKEYRLVSEQREWEQSAALGRLLPGFSARGVYQFNEYAAVLPAQFGGGVITPQHQADAYLTIDLPIVDVAGHFRLAQADKTTKLAKAQEELNANQVQATVARIYYTLVGSAALVRSAEKSLQIAEQNAAFVSSRFDLGASTNLDLQRAQANVERAKQDLADAVLGRDLAARQLETLSGLTPTAVEQFPEVTLEEPAPLDTALGRKDTPADRIQSATLDVTRAGRDAARSAFAPTLSATAQERITNATGFTGQSASFTLQAVLSWRFDWNIYATARAQDAAVKAQESRRDEARRATEDGIYEAYQRVVNGIAKCTSSRAQSRAAALAAELAQERYVSGAATQLDVTQAQRDAFVADVNRVRADADLSFARAQLAVLTGQDLAKPANP